MVRQKKNKLNNSGIAELKKRFLFLMIGIFIYRLGSHIPVPGLDPVKLANFFNKEQAGILGLFNMFSGGALQRLTIFALGVMPYISSSIIIQLFGVIVPALEVLKKEGASGRRKLNQYTRLGTLFLSLIQSLGIAKWLTSAGIVLQPGLSFYLVTILTLTAGALFLMWVGEQMNEHGVGNGISMLIFAGIVSRFPTAVIQVLNEVRQGQMQVINFFLLVVVIALITSAVVFIERGQRKIVVSYVKRQAYGGYGNTQTSSLPLKINMAGVIPPIFASSLVLFPATLARWFGVAKGMGWLNTIGNALQMGQPLYMLIYALAIIFFSYFYTALVFNPKEIADNLKKSGALIPGVRPGENTAQYIDTIITRLTFFGAIYITLISLMPDILMYIWHMPFHFGGTSLLIVVVVLMDFMVQVQSYLMTDQYDSLVKKARFNRR